MADTLTPKTVQLPCEFAHGCSIYAPVIPWTNVDGVVTPTGTPTPEFPYNDILESRPEVSVADRLVHVYGDALPDDETPGWLAASDPFFADIEVPDDAYWGFTLAELGVNDFPKDDGVYNIQDPEVSLDGAIISPDWYRITETGFWWVVDGYENAPFTSAVAGRTLSITYGVIEVESILTDGTDGGATGDAQVVGNPDFGMQQNGLGVWDGVPKTLKLAETQVSDIALPIESLEIDFLEIPVDATVKFLVYAEDATTLHTEYPAAVVNGFAEVSDFSMEKSGVYPAQLNVYAVGGDLIYTIPYFVGIEPVAGWTSTISITEMRLHMMDAVPSDNLLLDDYEFKDTEILYALNAILDRMTGIGLPSPRLTLSTIPQDLRWAYKQGVNATLLKLAAKRYARNELPYSAGGISVNDQAKANTYMGLSAEPEQEFIDAVLSRKQRQNIMNGFLTLR